MFLQVTFIVNIDGSPVFSVENTDPREFDNVKVFTADNFQPAANASYRNLVWNKLPGKNVVIHRVFSRANILKNEKNSCNYLF